MQLQVWIRYVSYSHVKTVDPSALVQETLMCVLVVNEHQACKKPRGEAQVPTDTMHMALQSRHSKCFPRKDPLRFVNDVQISEMCECNGAGHYAKIMPMQDVLSGLKIVLPSTSGLGMPKQSCSVWVSFTRQDSSCS